MEAGVFWEEADASRRIRIGRTTASRWAQKAVLQDDRHGHPAKALPPVLHRLESRCQSTQLVASSQAQKERHE